jgi:hypothetical protein
MEVSTEAVRQNFQSKADTELVELAASAKGLTSGARLILLQELENRLVSAKGAGETVQLIHGWYTVVAPRRGLSSRNFVRDVAGQKPALRWVSNHWSTASFVSSIGKPKGLFRRYPTAPIAPGNLNEPAPFAHGLEGF